MPAKTEKQMKSFLSVLAITTLLPVISFAQSVTTHEYDGSFEDATQSIESAIIGKGLTIDWVSHIGDMLKRTGPDVGSEVVVFENADTFLFCSATVSRKMMEADPLNIGYCPYGLFVAEIADGTGKVLIGYRNQPEGIMQEVQTLLEEIAQEALSF